MNKNEEYGKYASGLVIVKSKNSNFNADFTGTPRRLPDENGTIYATDKALKYCMRKYLKDEGEKVFVWRRKKETDQPMDIIENYEMLFEKKLNDVHKTDIIKDLVSCIDVRLFGVTFAPRKETEAKNVSIIGPVQISYGIDKFTKNIHYTNQISSPYRDSTDTNAQQTTIGEESKGLESHYVFDYVVNPKHLKDSTKHLEEYPATLKTRDLDKFLAAACLGVNNVNSTSKIGSENELVLHIEYDAPLCLQNLKDFVEIIPDKESNKIRIILKPLREYLFGNMGIFSDKETEVTVKIFYDPGKTIVEGFEVVDPVEKLHIIKGMKI